MKPAVKSLSNTARLLEEIPLPIASAARGLHAAIKQYYPIQGQTWRYARSCGLATRAECAVYNALRRLFSLLDHDRTPNRRDPLEIPFRLTHRWPPDAISWRDLLDAFAVLAEDIHAIAMHYGWADTLYNGAPWVWPWQWPDVPQIPANLFQSLLDHADRIEALTLPWLEAIHQKLNAAPVTKAVPEVKKNPNDPRDKFVYNSRKARKSLQKIKNKIAAHPRWETLASIQGVSAAGKRYAIRNNLPWPT